MQSNTDPKANSRTHSVVLNAIIASFIGGLTSASILLLCGVYPQLAKLPIIVDAYDFLYHWQTFAGAIAALIAAAVAFLAVSRQTTIAQRTSIKIWEEQKRGTERKALTNLPIALSSISTYAEHQWDSLSELATKIRANEEFNLSRDMFPSAPHSAIQALSDICQYPTDQRIAEDAMNIVRRIQYQEARLEHSIDKGRTLRQAECTEFLLVAAEIRTISSSLFDYSDRQLTRYTDVNKLRSTVRSLGLSRENDIATGWVNARLDQRERSLNEP